MIESSRCAFKIPPDESIGKGEQKVTEPFDTLYILFYNFYLIYNTDANILIILYVITDIFSTHMFTFVELIKIPLELYFIDTQQGHPK